MTDRRQGQRRPTSQSQRSVVRKVTWVGLIVNLLLSSARCGAGFWGHSQAVFADGIHGFSDMATDAAILLGVRYWTRPADSNHPHGHQRIEMVVTLCIGLVLAAVATGLLWNAVMTLHEHQAPASPPGLIAFAAAVVSMAAKEALYRWTAAAGQRIKSMSLVANAWHHRSDALSSFPAALAVAGAAIGPEWTFLDHVGAIAVSLFIYQAAIKIVRPALDMLIDSGAPEEELHRIRALALATDGVRDVHALRTRYASGSALLVDLHIRVAADMTVREGHDISEVLKTRLMTEGPGIVDVMVHLEPYGERD